MRLRDMKQKRTKLGLDARAILNAANAESRDLTPDEEQSFDRMMDERDKLDKDIDREERVREDEDVEHDDRIREDDPTGGGGGRDGDEQERAWRAFLVGGIRNLTEAQARALNAGVDPEGGYLVAPQQFVQSLIQKVDDAIQLRPLATVETLTQAESLGVPTLDTDLLDATWTSEIETGADDDSLRFGKRELRPHPLAKRVKVSRTLLRKSTRNPEVIVQDRLAYRFGVTQEKAFMTGDGNEKPLGLFTASAQGISTARDVEIGAAGAIPLTTATADQLIDAKYTLKAAYYRRARWLFHRDLIRTVRKIKDANGLYVWQAGLTIDRPDTILEIPFVLSEFAPNTIAANNYVGMLADFSFYWIVDALNLEVQRLVELYAEKNQVGFIARAEVDGMPVLEEAFVRIKVKA